MDSKAEFDVILKPNPPLSPRGLVLLFGCAALPSLIFSLWMLSRGAWPVTPFFGLDIAALAWALNASVKASRRAERVVLTPESFIVHRFDARGVEREDRIGAYFARVEHDDPELLGAELAIIERKKRLVIGSFLGAGERASLADALRAAFNRLRRF